MINQLIAWFRAKITNPDHLVWFDFFVSFLGVELRAALNDKEGDTFSEFVWAFSRWRAARIAVGAFMGLLTSHFVFETPLFLVF